MKFIHARLLGFPEGLVPVGLVDHLPFPSPFEFLLGVRSGEEDRLLLLPLSFFLSVLEAARISSFTLAFRGPI